jgi:uncharacterized Zn finger protein (UPF0148 family)
VCGSGFTDKLMADNCCKPKLCDDCGCELPKNHYYVVCNECRAKRESIKELDRYNKATKYTFKSVPKESIEYVYNEKYPCNEGYFNYDDEDELEYDIKYVYGTKRISPTYDAWDIVESMLEESYEDADDQVENKELEKLQQAIDTFIKNHNGCLDHFEVDYSVVIDL